MIFIIKRKTYLRSFYTTKEKITINFIAENYFFNIKKTNINYNF